MAAPCILDQVDRSAGGAHCSLDRVRHGARAAGAAAGAVVAVAALAAGLPRSGVSRARAIGRRRSAAYGTAGAAGKTGPSARAAVSALRLRERLGAGTGVLRGRNRRRVATRTAVGPGTRAGQETRSAAIAAGAVRLGDQRGSSGLVGIGRTFRRAARAARSCGTVGRAARAACAARSTGQRCLDGRLTGGADVVVGFVA